MSVKTSLQAWKQTALGLLRPESAMTQGLLGGVISPGGTPPDRGTVGYLEGYSTMPWLRAIAAKISFAVANTEWTVSVAVRNPKSARAGESPYYQWKAAQWAGREHRTALLSRKRKQAELREIEDHPLLDALQRGNAFQTGFQLQKLTQIYLDLVGDSFWLKERNGVGAPVGFWPLPPHWIRKTPSATLPFYEIGYQSYQERIPDTEILWLSDPNPVYPYGRGTGHTEAVGDELEVDEFAAKLSKTVFINRARPDLLVMPKEGLMKPEEVAHLEQNWLNRSQGFWRAFRPFFLRRAVEVTKFDHNFRNIQLTSLRQHQRDTIMQTFGLPPEIMGVIESSNRATIESADHLFSKYVIVPRLESIRSQLQQKLVPEYDERLILDYVSPVQEDKERQLKAAQIAPWALTVDEWRD
jgi:hypothetical protein